MLLNEPLLTLKRIMQSKGEVEGNEATNEA